MGEVAKIALGIGSKVTILDVDLASLRYLDDILEGKATTLVSNSTNIEAAVADADLVVGAVLTPGARTSCLVWSEPMRLDTMG